MSEIKNQNQMKMNMCTNLITPLKKKVLKLAEKEGKKHLPLLFQHELKAKFGQDFSDVDVCVSPQACRMIGARAFSVGRVVVFADEHPPKDLVEHELTHIIQENTQNN